MTPEDDPALRRLVELLRSPEAPVSPRSAARAWEEHVADSLTGLGFEEISQAERLCDLGSGAGLPGLVLASRLPETSVTLLEATSRKCEFVERAVVEMQLDNVRVVDARSEDWARGEGREAYDVVCARAVGGLSTTAELASPLLADGGVLAIWRGRRDPEEEDRLDRASTSLAVAAERTVPVEPFPGSHSRHIHLLRKNGATPTDLPRRPGVAAKRPFGDE